MVNIDDFIKRLEIILDYYGLNASSFADKIGVQRSSMSHLLSGRNKPSLDFVMKIFEVFPEVDLYWVLNGKGSFPKIEEKNITNHKEKIPEIIIPINTIESNETLEMSDLFSKSNFEDEEPNSSENSTEGKNLNINRIEKNEIEKIVFFYNNGTFKVYHP